jgi:putative ABC transport system substrate-binding protein
MRTAARSFGIEALSLDVRNRDGIGPAFEAAVKKRVDALIVQNGAPTQANVQLTVDLAARHRLPAIYASREFVDVGGLMTYGVSYPDLYRRAAAYVDKILRGARPADLPIQQPTKLELVINLKTAKALGLTISESFLLRADEVIE